MERKSAEIGVGSGSFGRGFTARICHKGVRERDLRPLVLIEKIVETIEKAGEVGSQDKDKR